MSFRYLFKYIIYSSWQIILFILIGYIIALYNSDVVFNHQIKNIVRLILDDGVARTIIAVLILAPYIPIGEYSLYRYVKAVNIITERIVTKIPKKELVALLITINQLKITSNSDEPITLSFRTYWHDHNIAIFDCSEGVKIIASEHIFKCVIDPTLKNKGIS